MASAVIATCVEEQSALFDWRSTSGPQQVTLAQLPAPERRALRFLARSLLRLRGNGLRGIKHTDDEPTCRTARPRPALHGPRPEHPDSCGGGVAAPAPRQQRRYTAALCAAPATAAAEPARPESAGTAVAAPAAAPAAAAAAAACQELDTPAALHPLPQQHPERECGPLRRLLRPVVHAVRALLARVSPQGPGFNDTTRLERLGNVVTTLPFLLVGARVLRRRAAPASRHFGAAFIGVGVVAGVYHATSGPCRNFLRKLDYWSICYASGVLRHAAHVRLPVAAQLALAALVPVKPTAVTAINLALTEAKFISTAVRHSHLLSAWGVHAGAAVTGIACFLYEDTAIARGWPPVFHCLWHVLSALAMGTSSALLAHLEGGMVLEAALLVEGLQARALHQV